MEFVSETIIEKVLEKLDDQGYFNSISENLIDSQPTLIAYLESESFQILAENEKDLLWYCMLVISTSCDKSTEKLRQIKSEVLEQAEEDNYEMVGENMKYSDMADLFFKDYRQEDLLAFVEDTLAPDEEEEEEFITPVGRKVLFMSLKTIIDAYDEVY